MKQINGIVLIFLTLGVTCLGIPLNSETSLNEIVKLEENSSTNVPDLEPTTNLPQLESEITINTPENAVIVEIPEINKETKSTTKQQESEIKLESERNIDDNKKSVEKEDDNKFKDSEENLEELHKQSELWKDFVDDFSLLADRMPDLTEEDYDELKKEGAMPFNFLKSLDSGKKSTDSKRHGLKSLTPIFITVPIVINSNSHLPISLSVGGQEIPIKLPSSSKESVVMANNMKATSTNSMATPTSIFNKLLDYNEPPLRQTNRHRSNNRKKIYARNSNHQVEEFELKNEQI